MRNWLRTRTCLGNKILFTRGLKPIERNLGTLLMQSCSTYSHPNRRVLWWTRAATSSNIKPRCHRPVHNRATPSIATGLGYAVSFDVPPFSRLYGYRYLDQDYCLSVQPNSVDLHRGMMLSARVRAVLVTTLNGRVAAVCCAEPTPSVLLEKSKFQLFLGINGVSAVNVVLHLSGSLCTGYPVGVHPH